jgi:superoxide reductase
MKYFICQVCGHIAFENIPDNCPVCGSPKEKYIQNDNVFAESKAKSPEADAKHIPFVVIEKECGLIKDTTCSDAHIKIGQVTHPMEAKHYIVFVECYLDNVYVARFEFTPNGVNPAGALHIKNPAKKLTVVERCNIHGYWMSETSL